MGRLCCVIGCESSVKNKPLELKFHVIPAEMNRRKRWIDQIDKHSGFRRGKLTDQTCICNLHFSPDDYSFSGRLLPAAEPTLFGSKRRRIEISKRSIFD